MTPMTPTKTDIVPEPGGTLTYDQSNQLMNDPNFRGRVKVACVKFANSINNEPTDTPAHNSRWRWANACLLNPDLVAGQVTPPTVMDPNVQTNGSAVDDPTLQGAVEKAVEAFM